MARDFSGTWLQAAALARIAELCDRTQTPRSINVHAEPENEMTSPTARQIWRRGDYDRFATELVWEVGPVVVEAAGIGPGQRVLDVATGTGNVALRAAQAGADVVASDVTIENFEAGKRHAERLGVSLQWTEADAQDLPFGDDEFDVVTSSFGALFAPDHQRVAAELTRVCRPGGRIAMANFTPEGLFGAFIDVFAPFMPPPQPGALPPTLWGSESHVRELFGDRIGDLRLERLRYTESAPSPQAYVELFKETFGPTVALYEALASEPDRLAALDRAFLDFAIEANTGPAGGPARYEYEYLLVVGTVAGSHGQDG